MAKIYSFLFYVRSRTEPLHFIVDKDDYDRLSKILDDVQGPVDLSFFWFDATDGTSVIINLHAVQAVRFLWDAPRLLVAREPYDGPIQIYLRGREESIETDVGSAESIHDFFSQLELDPKMFPFPGFIDGDGEYLNVNAVEVDLIVAPKELMDEGARIAQEELEEITTRPQPNLVRKK